MIQIYKWSSNRPSVEGYEVAILDLYFGETGVDGYKYLPEIFFSHELGTEVARSLQAGGIVIALLGSLAVTNRDIPIEQPKLIKNQYKYEGKLITDKETSYDWLDQGFIQQTKIDILHAKESTNVEIDLYDYQVHSLARWINNYFVSISGIRLEGKSKASGYIKQHVAQQERWGVQSYISYPVKILAVGKHTKLPVAAAMKYMNWDGVLILLPICRLKQTDDQSRTSENSELVYSLYGLARNIKADFATTAKAEHENWVYDYRPEKAKELVSNIEKLEQEKNKLTTELEFYDRILVLIDGTGTHLEDGVVTLFDKPSEGLKVEKTQRDSPIDIFVSDKNGKRLAIEVTGIGGVLSKNDPHWSDFLGYIPEHNALNEKERVERIVLIVNTHCKTKLSERSRQNDISLHARNTAIDNHICVIRSVDLFNLWLKTHNGLTIQEIFDNLFKTEGIFEARE